MINVERILCPISPAPESDDALRYAVALARAYQAKLLLLHCTQAPPSIDNPFPDQTLASVNDRFEDALLRNHGLENMAGLEWEGIVVEGGNDAGYEIVQIANDRNVDLIVMRSRRRPLAAAILGSTAERVCKTAPCPVLVTHPHEQEWVSAMTGEIELKRVLVAHDFSDDSKLAFRYAASLAQEYQADLHVMHVLAHPKIVEPEIAWGPAVAETSYHVAARRLQLAIPAEAFLWCNIVSVVRWGKPYEEVLTYATENEIDLVCLGAKGKDASSGTLFGSNVDRVLRNAPCPILVARPQKAASSMHPSRGIQIPAYRQL